MIDRFKSEDWPMLPHSEPESYPDDWEQIKPKTLCSTSDGYNCPCRRDGAVETATGGASDTLCNS